MLVKKKKEHWLCVCSFSSDKKEFDAFISYANQSSLESEATGPLSEEHLALNLFPEVLENKYGYTLCLLERDVTPGGGRCTLSRNQLEHCSSKLFLSLLLCDMHLLWDF